MEERIFALDIGTHSVTGILLGKDNGKFTVIDTVTKEHKERSMRDGQIHNVVAVSDVIKMVKESLEAKHNKLHSVSVAAAGRALKTVQATASINLNEHPIPSIDMIKHLELSAVQSAQAKLAESGENQHRTNYYCVGYSVLHYKLDNEIIGSLIDQSGQIAAVDIIATFLPKVVVESLLAALQRSELEMEALTLEPIAAIHVLIPESMRRLNVALVDIGAGTSDIALTDKGTVSAYGMVPIAGDEITEAISDQYLLDFPKAERAKRMIVNNGEYVVQDILGFDTTVTYEMLVKDISQSVEKLASSIAGEIIKLNSRPPKAVMLIGGGSLTPEITAMLADKLQLPLNRVAVRGIDAIQNLDDKSSLPAGPDYITPLGIAIAAKENPVHYVTVTLNGRTIRMFEMKQLTIGDCLIQAGIEINKWYGKLGMAAYITVNGSQVTIPGSLGIAPMIKLNDQHANVDDIIHNGDNITIESGANGTDAHTSLSELADDIPIRHIQLNSKTYALEPIFEVNGQQRDGSYIIQDNDSIIIRQIRDAKEFLTAYVPEMRQTSFGIYLNNDYIKMGHASDQLFINGEPADLNQVLKNGDSLILEKHSDKDRKLQDALRMKQLEYWNVINVTFNGKAVTLKQPCLQILRGEQSLTDQSVLRQNDHLLIKELDKEPFIFQDIFRFIDIDLTGVNGNFQLFKNDQPTSFHEQLQQGDRIQIVWQ